MDYDDKFENHDYPMSDEDVRISTIISLPMQYRIECKSDKDLKKAIETIKDRKPGFTGLRLSGYDGMIIIEPLGIKEGFRK